MTIQIGATAPDFEAKTTEGLIQAKELFGEWRAPKPYTQPKGAS